MSSNYLLVFEQHRKNIISCSDLCASCVCELEVIVGASRNEQNVFSLSHTPITKGAHHSLLTMLLILLQTQHRHSIKNEPKSNVQRSVVYVPWTNENCETVACITHSLTSFTFKWSNLMTDLIWRVKLLASLRNTLVRVSKGFNQGHNPHKTSNVFRYPSHAGTPWSNHIFAFSKMKSCSYSWNFRNSFSECVSVLPTVTFVWGIPHQPSAIIHYVAEINKPSAKAITPGERNRYPIKHN